MRIIGGKFRGRRFHPPADNWPTRPTTDFAKEAIFNILQNTFDFEEMKVLDLFGGTGTHTYEFVSRGCCDVTYVDNFRGCVAFVQKTVKMLDIENAVRIVSSDVFKFLQREQEQYDYIFADPPYDLPILETIPEIIFERQLLRPGGWLILEHSPKHSFQSHLHFAEERHYGKTIFSIFKFSGE